MIALMRNVPNCWCGQHFCSSGHIFAQIPSRVNDFAMTNVLGLVGKGGLLQRDT